MTSHMHSLLKSRKAQFFILTAFAIVSIIYFISKWMEPTGILDTSQIVLMEEPFIFSNIVEKSVQVINSSKDCEELKFNLEEYKMFVENYALSKVYNLNFTYTLPPCTPPITVPLEIKLSSVRMRLATDFSVAWQP